MRITDQEFNRLKLLKAIRRAEPVARTDLVQLTGLAGGTITELTADLLTRKVIVEEKSLSAARGRPRIQLRLNPRAAHVVGAFLRSSGSLVTEIVNIRGELVFAQFDRIGDGDTLEHFARQIAEIIADAIAASPISKQDIHRVGVALPALIDSLGGVVHWLQTYPHQPVPFASIIEQQLQLPVVIDNITNIVARGEHWFGIAALEDFSLFTLDLGLGHAQYADGALRSGAHGMNSEFGHVKAALNGGPACSCGSHGCLETYCGIYGLVARICEQRGREMPALPNIVSVLQEFARDARAGDRDARPVFELAGRLLGTGIANHINHSDPGRIVMAAFDSVLPELLSPSFGLALEQHTLPPLRNQSAVEWRVVDEDCYRKGAAALVLEQIYRLPVGAAAAAPRAVSVARAIEAGARRK